MLALLLIIGVLYLIVSVVMFFAVEAESKSSAWWGWSEIFMAILVALFWPVTYPTLVAKDFLRI